MPNFIKKIFMSLWVYRLTRLVLGCIFIYSGFMKITDPQHFAVIIEAYGLIPENMVFPVAMAIIIAEICAGAGILIDVKASLTVITGLMILFIAILGYGIIMGLDADCGCFGPDDPEALAFHGLRHALYRDLVLLSLILYLYFFRSARRIKPISLNKINHQEVFSWKK